MIVGVFWAVVERPTSKRLEDKRAVWARSVKEAQKTVKATDEMPKKKHASSASRRPRFNRGERVVYKKARGRQTGKKATWQSEPAPGWRGKEANKMWERPYLRKKKKAPMTGRGGYPVRRAVFPALLSPAKKEGPGDIGRKKQIEDEKKSAGGSNA